MQNYKIHNAKFQKGLNNSTYFACLIMIKQHMFKETGKLSRKIPFNSPVVIQSGAGPIKSSLAVTCKINI
uniref:Uncharacterized protein n=1 Tax=Manihot esculenta TaxID=3983 RepID=A0A2C9VH23_MANES